jgi:hypothetical protein
LIKKNPHAPQSNAVFGLLSTRGEVLSGTNKDWALQTALYIGWTGYSNLGDEAMLEVCEARFARFGWVPFEVWNAQPQPKDPLAGRSGRPHGYLSRLPMRSVPSAVCAFTFSVLRSAEDTRKETSAVHL